MKIHETRTFAVNPNIKENWFGIRHVQYLMLFIAVNIAYGIRAVLSIAIFPMTAEDPPDKNIPTYPEWAEHKNMMLSSFFWGYICFQLIAGQLIKNYGPKWFLGGAVFIGSLFCALIPFIGAKTGYGGVIFCRIMTGLTQGFIFPSIHCLLSSWTAIQDRAKFGSFVYAGGNLGNVISMPIAGLISNSSFGWPWVFYLYGTLGMAWTFLWFSFGSDTPSKHSKITQKEIMYIEQDSTNKREDSANVVPTPWKAIFLSPPFWAILIAHCGQNFGFWTLLTETPSYMYHILNFDLKSNSTLSSLPYLVNWILSLFISPLADYLIVKKYVTLGQSRKIFNSIGLFIPAAALIALTFVGSSNTSVAVLLLTLAVGFNSGIYSGYNVNHIDISPVHAGTLMSLTNTVSNIFSLISPLVVDFIVSITGYAEIHAMINGTLLFNIFSDLNSPPTKIFYNFNKYRVFSWTAGLRTTTEKQLWSFVFWLASGTYIICGCIYDIFASGEVQPWNSLPESSSNSNDTKEEKHSKLEELQMEKIKT